MITRILLILPIINFAFALPIAVQETRQLSGDVVPDVAITMSAKRGDEVQERRGMYSERLSGNPESDLAGLKGLFPFDRLQYPPQMGTSELQQVSPELSKSEISDHYILPSELLKSPILADYMAPPGSSKSPSLDHHVVPPELSKPEISDHYMLPSELLKSPILADYMASPGSSKSPSLDHHVVPPVLSKSEISDHYMLPSELLKSSVLEDYMALPEPSKSPSLDHYTVVSTSESGLSPSAASKSQSTTSSPVEKPKSKSFLIKAVNKVKLWRRIFGPGFVSDTVNEAQRVSQGLVNIGVYVSASSPESPTF